MALSKEKFDTVITWNSNTMSKYIMQRDNLNEETARKKLMDMEIYKLMLDQESGIWEECNEYLCECCEVELSQGIDALYNFFKE